MNDIDRLESEVCRLENKVSLLETVLRHVIDKVKDIPCPLSHTVKMSQWADEECEWCGINIPGQRSIDIAEAAERKRLREEKKALRAASQALKKRTKDDL
jgi:hypothetical protein